MGGENLQDIFDLLVSAGSSPRGRGKPSPPTLRAPRSRLIPAWAGKTCARRRAAWPTTAHPRVGGENPLTGRCRASGVGSSPRGRGKLRLFWVLAIGERLIPAWAGKTPGPRRRQRERAAHPRVGGENRATTRSLSAASGSSPRGRGKPLGRRSHRRPLRLIPAWAGKTLEAVGLHGLGPAHPRVGRENAVLGATGTGADGSSPRGRGKPPVVRVDARQRRLIPAWAGKTAVCMASMRRDPAHPRVGGENSVSPPTRRSQRGSSPRGRGKLGGVAGVETACRLIPAWAGKTSRTCSRAGCHGAHPRVGGENWSFQRSRVTKGGSSPRGRGKLEEARADLAQAGLIPAWAGKTTASPGANAARPAHPRVGGENKNRAASATPTSGSSPRGRGKPSCSHSCPLLGRLIPAWAGKTRPLACIRSGTTAHPRVGGENAQQPPAVLRGGGSSPRGRGKQTEVRPRLQALRLIPAWAGKT